MRTTWATGNPTRWQMLADFWGLEHLSTVNTESTHTHTHTHTHTARVPQFRERTGMVCDFIVRNCWTLLRITSSSTKRIVLRICLLLSNHVPSSPNFVIVRDCCVPPLRSHIRQFGLCFGQSGLLRMNVGLNVHSWLKCCFTFTETVGLLGTGAQDGHLDFHSSWAL